MTREETLEALRSRSTVTLREAADALGYSSSEAYRAARSGKLRTIRIGRRILVATALLERLITAQDGGER
jgi:excisionase family DNA binding protein